MTPEPEQQRLPASLGGLIEYGFAAYAARAPLYLLLALGAFAVEVILEYALPGLKAESVQGALKLLILNDAALLADAYIVASVALGVATRLSGEDAPANSIARAALPRWLAVIFIMLIGQLVFQLTQSYGAIGLDPLPSPAALLLLTAPLLWLLWGILALAAPIAALTGEPVALAAFTGLTRAFSLSLRSCNLARLCAIAFLSVLPNLLEQLAYDAMLHYHPVPRPIFWADFPIDALAAGPLAALQTVFAIDFARRAAAQHSV